MMMLRYTPFFTTGPELSDHIILTRLTLYLVDMKTLGDFFGAA